MSIPSILREASKLLTETVQTLKDTAEKVTAVNEAGKAVTEKVKELLVEALPKPTEPAAPAPKAPEAVTVITTESAPKEEAPKTEACFAPAPVAVAVVTEATPPKAEACFAAPAVAVLAQACFAPRRRPVAMVGGVAVPPPPVERSRYFTIESVGVGDLPIGAWKVTKAAAGAQGSDWAALPYPTGLKEDIKKLEELMLKAEGASLSDEEKQQKAALETKYEIVA